MRFDLAVIGGGPAGAAAAIRAAQSGYSVMIAEAAADAAFRIGETVPPDLEPVLRTLGAWDAFLRDGHIPVEGACSAWGSAELNWQDGFAQTHGGGWRLDRVRFDASLLCTAQAAGVTILPGHRIGGAEYQDGEWRLSSGLSARLLVDATGRSAAFARRFGAIPMRADRLTATYARLATNRPLRHTLVEAFEYGWWYAASVPDGTAVVSLFTDADIARRLDVAKPANWHRLFAATQHAHTELGKPAAPSDLCITSASSYCLDRAYGPGWLAAGDAATAWDPLASAGIYLALRGGIEAADAVVRGETAFAGYQRTLQLRFTQYLFERRSYYAIETRWPESPFWLRRSGTAKSPRPSRPTGSAAPMLPR